MRQRLNAVVQSGTCPCVRCGELIEPGSEWHLDHRDDGRGWLGPSHAKCNQRAGWEKMVASANGRGIVPEEKPYKWSASRTGFREQARAFALQLAPSCGLVVRALAEESKR